ncbi:type-2 ice-structuring protein-like isoform X2 [Simochromis diagramma]|uniref:type-2 ice-structuring protein-like isoform X2 n=1 Tax=Simochromis diagramma TaxID=43689 RepID=UPI001A7E3CD4|nr:type-2 ice-structuring protein-like isoform X2 [Simochromis diagramma]XP_039883223.1 type-2 ice-structuring protein-like isoform X2 [Simochromis diagramma]
MSQILNITMKKLTACAIFCAIIALTMAASLQCAEPRDKAEEFLAPAKSRVVKRSPRSPCCPGGWTKYGHRCFFFNSTVASWADAEKSCKSMRAHLASVRNIKEYREIQRLTGKKESWIGGTDASKEGKWLWSDETSFTYKKWCFREPNNDRNQDCLQINRGVFKCWDDMWCDAHLPSVCAKNI